MVRWVHIRGTSYDECCSFKWMVLKVSDGHLEFFLASNGCHWKFLLAYVGNWKSVLASREC